MIHREHGAKYPVALVYPIRVDFFQIDRGKNVPIFHREGLAFPAIR